MGKGMRVGLLVGIILIGMIVGASPAKASPYIPIAVLTFDEPCKTVDVSPGADRTAIFNGTLESDCETGYSVRLEVDNENSSIPPNWYVTISPSSVTHDSGPHTDYISVIVRAPPEESYAETATIKIQSYTCRNDVGQWYYGGSADIFVSVKPYYMFSVSCSEPYKETLPDSNVSFVLQIANKGNAPLDDICMDVNNKDELDNWIVIMPTSPLTINEKSTVNVSVNILMPKEEHLGIIQKIAINVSSQTANLSKTYSLYVSLPHLIKNFSPLTDPTINETENINFSVILPDIPDLMINWYIDGKILLESGSAYTFSSDYDSAGTYNVTVTVFRGNVTENHTWILSVTNVNRAPTAIISSPTNSSKFTTKDNVVFDAGGSYDPDNETLTYTWSSNVDGGIGNTSSFSTKLSAGTHLITLTVTDENLSDAKQITITIEKPSERPWWFISADSWVIIGVICVVIATIMVLCKLKKIR